MLGHLVSHFVCLVVGHYEPVWECGAYGLQWRCQRCLRVQVSPALRRDGR